MSETTPIIHRLEELEAKLRKLIREHEELRSRYSELIIENQSLKGIVERQNEEIKNFQNQDKITKLVSSIADGAPNSAELKLKINEYIKEIDRCIVFLSE